MKRGRSSILLLATLAALVVAATVGLAEGEDYEVQGDEHRSNEEWVLDGNLTVPAGSSLILENTSLTFVGETGKLQFIHVLDGGSLTLDGSSHLKAAPSHTYSFVVDGNLTVTGDPETPVQIEDVRGRTVGGVLGLDRPSVDGLLIRGNASLEHFTYRNTTSSILVQRATSVHIEACTVITDGTITVLFIGVPDAAVHACRLFPRGTGLYISDSDVVLDDVLVHARGLGYGMRMLDSSVQASNFRAIGGNVSIQATGDSDLDFDGGSLSKYTRMGIVAKGAPGKRIGLTVRNVTLAPAPGGQVGVSASQLGAAHLENNSAGFHLDSAFSFGPASSLVLRNNQLYGSLRYGLVLSNVEADRSGTIFGEGDHANTLGQIFEFRDLELRIEETPGEPAANRVVNVTATWTDEEGNTTRRSLGLVETNDRGRAVLDAAPYRFQANDGAVHTFEFEVTVQSGDGANRTATRQPQGDEVLVVLSEDSTTGEADGRAAPGTSVLATALALGTCAIVLQSRRRRGA